MTFLVFEIYCTFVVQVPDLDAIVGSVSGGGFVAGMCVAAKVSFYFMPRIHSLSILTPNCCCRVYYSVYVYIMYVCYHLCTR